MVFSLTLGAAWAMPYVSTHNIPLLQVTSLKVPAQFLNSYTLAIYIIREASFTFCYIQHLSPFPSPPPKIQIHLLFSRRLCTPSFLRDVIPLFISAVFIALPFFHLLAVSFKIQTYSRSPLLQLTPFPGHYWLCSLFETCLLVFPAINLFPLFLLFCIFLHSSCYHLTCCLLVALIFICPLLLAPHKNDASPT